MAGQGPKQLKTTAEDPSSLPQSTRHKHEAEALLDKALKEEAAKHQHEALREGQKRVPERVESKHKINKEEEPNLTGATQYLQALHENRGDSEAADGDEKSGHDEPPPSEGIYSSSTERVFQVAAVLQGTQKFKHNIKKKGEAAPVVEPNDESSDGENSKHRNRAGEEEDSKHENDNNSSNNDNFVEEGEDETEKPTKPSLHAFPARVRDAIQETLNAGNDEWHSLTDFFRPTSKSVCDEVFFVLMGCVFPCLLTAFILFYLTGNPPTGRCEDGIPCGFNSQGEPIASASWWVNFLGVRQVLMWLLAKGWDVFFIDWLFLQHPLCVKVLGARLTLILVQSKGWPSVLFWWGIFDFFFLYGKAEFNAHWLHWQKFLKIFTDENPAGDVTTAEWYRSILITMILVSISVSLKRHYVGVHLGQRLFTRFNDRLEEVMKEVTLISELSIWTRRKTDQAATFGVWLSDYAPTEDPEGPSMIAPTPKASAISAETEKQEQAGRQNESDASEEQDQSEGQERSSSAAPRHSIAEGGTVDYEKLLEEWDEPELGYRGEEVSGGHIIAFRQAFAVLTRPYFFSSAFGPVESRHLCVESADRLFRRLLRLMEEQESIDLNNLTRWMYKGFHTPKDKETAAHLFLLLNPDNEGRVTIIDFVRGIDTVYKRVRLLENAVNNASHIDQGYEKVLNVVFYFFLGVVVLVVLGLDPLGFLVSLTGLIVAFSFMIGPGSAQYFEGIMMVLGRQPYDVGDKVAIATVDDPPNPDGSTHWMVESIDLVTTTARLMGTGEIASFSNGALARMRLMNMNRSPNPTVYVYVRFGIDVPYSTIQVFRSAVEKFVEDRPQEWEGMTGFRTNRVEPQLNFVEYSIVLQHRETWQSLIPIKESKAAVSSFCVEIQNQLGCRYTAPSMPIELTLTEPQQLDNKDTQDDIGARELNETESSMEVIMETAKQFQASRD